MTFKESLNVRFQGLMLLLFPKTTIEAVAEIIVEKLRAGARCD